MLVDPTCNIWITVYAIHAHEVPSNIFGLSYTLLRWCKRVGHSLSHAFARTTCNNLRCDHIKTFYPHTQIV